MKREEVIENGAGIPTTASVLAELTELAMGEAGGEGASATARLRALELLGKHLGLFADHGAPPGEAPIQIIDDVPDLPL